MAEMGFGVYRFSITWSRIFPLGDEDIPVMAKRADAEGNPLYPVPLLMDATDLESLYHSVQEPAPAGAADESGEQAAETEDVAGSATDAARMPAASLPHRLAHAVRTQIRRARRAARRAGSRIRTNR